MKCEIEKVHDFFYIDRKNKNEMFYSSNRQTNREDNFTDDN